MAGERSAVSSAASWSARRSSSAGSLGAAATNTVAWGAVFGPEAVDGADDDEVVGEAAAGLAVVFVVAGGDVVVELSADVDVDAGAVVVDDSGRAASPLSPSSPPHAPASVRATSRAAILLVDMSRSVPGPHVLAAHLSPGKP